MNSTTTPHEMLDRLRLAAQDEDKAREMLEALRWPKGAACPRCGSVGVYQMKDAAGNRNKDGRWRCRDCDKMFSVRTGTVLEETRLPLKIWVHAFWSAIASKKGISALQIKRETGISYQSALFLMHRVRKAMTEDSPAPLTGTVEVDETYVGGKPRKGQWKPKRETGRGTLKTPVVALVQRNGEVRTEVIEFVNSKTLKGAIREHVGRKSTIMTDEWPAYRGIGKEFEGGHFAVKHGRGEYARGNIHSNTAESYFALLKRGIYGTFHNVSKKHLHRYCSEFGFKWNTRTMNDAQRFETLVKAADGKRLTYKQQLGREVRNEKETAE